MFDDHWSELPYCFRHCICKHGGIFSGNRNTDQCSSVRSRESEDCNRQPANCHDTRRNEEISSVCAMGWGSCDWNIPRGRSDQHSYVYCSRGLQRYFVNYRDKRWVYQGKYCFRTKNSLADHHSHQMDMVYLFDDLPSFFIT